MDIRKLMKALPTGFAETVAQMSGDDMRSAMILANTRVREIVREKEGDEKLEAARNLVKDLNEPYADALKAQRAKIDYLLWQLEERGELLELGEIEEESSE